MNYPFSACTQLIQVPCTLDGKTMERGLLLVLHWKFIEQEHFMIKIMEIHAVPEFEWGIMNDKIFSPSENS